MRQPQPPVSLAPADGEATPASVRDPPALFGPLSAVDPAGPTFFIFVGPELLFSIAPLEFVVVAPPVLFTPSVPFAAPSEDVFDAQDDSGGKTGALRS